MDEKNINQDSGSTLIEDFRKGKFTLAYLNDLYNTYIETGSSIDELYLDPKKNPLRNTGFSLTKDDEIYLGKILYLCRQLNIDENKEKYKELVEAKKIIEILLIYDCKAVISISSSQYPHSGVDKEDLVQYGIAGVLAAIEKYDYTLNYRFTTYASYSIRQKVTEAVRRGSRSIKLPNHIISVLFKIEGSKRKLQKKLDREPSIEELSLDTNISIEQISEYQKYSFNTISMQTNNSEDEDECSFEQVIPSEINIEETVCDESVKDALKKAFSTMSEKEVTVLTLRYGLKDGKQMTLEQIGDKMGITRERVRQIEAKALRNLRHHSRAKYLYDYSS